MEYKDILKDTIKNKISQVVDIPVFDSVKDTEKLPCLKPQLEYPKMLFLEYLEENKIKVIDYQQYDIKGINVAPKMDNIIGLYICHATKKSEILDYDGVEGVITLADNNLGLDLVEYMDELIIEQEVQPKEIRDYIFITSLSNFSKRLNQNVVEEYRRFEIGIFCYDDENENKCNYYMNVLKNEFDTDFEILGSDTKAKKMAYIFNPLKFNVTINGEENRVVYGSIMIKTYK